MTFLGWMWSRFVWGLEVQMPLSCLLSAVIGEIVQNPGFILFKSARVSVGLAQVLGPVCTLHWDEVSCFGQMDSPRPPQCPAPENQGQVTAAAQGPHLPHATGGGNTTTARLTFKIKEFLLACP